MNIVHINTLDTRGGAAKVCRNLALEQKRRGHTVTTFVGFKHSTDTDVHEIPRNPFYYRMSKFFANDLRFSRSDLILQTDEYKNADIIHCHNIHSGFFNLETLETMAREKPLIWTLQDLWAITSGCTDSYHCRIEKPRRVAGILWDNRPHLLKEKRETYLKSRFTVVTSSDWMLQNLTGSVLEHLPRHFIKNGIDTKIFTPSDKQAVRQELGLPLGKTVILFVATKGIGDQLKGADFIEEIARTYRDDPRFVFVAVGGGKKGQHGNTIQTGYLQDTDLARYYSSADFFLYPSRGDNSPLVVTESMACGTPVVSFETDGIPEMISGCGLVAKREDITDLKRAVEQMITLSPDQRAHMRIVGIEKVRQQYSIEKMTDEYLALYSECIGRRE